MTEYIFQFFGIINYHGKHFLDKDLNCLAFERFQMNINISGSIVEYHSALLVVSDDVKSVKHQNSILIPFSRWLSLIDINLAKNFLLALGFPPLITTQYITQLASFCINENLKYYNVKMGPISQEKLRTFLKKLGYHVSDICKGDFSIGSKHYKPKLNEIANHISLKQFLAFQSMYGIRVLHEQLEKLTDPQPQIITGEKEELEMKIEYENFDDNNGVDSSWKSSPSSNIL